MRSEPGQLPASVSHTGINLFAFVCVLAVLAVLQNIEALEPHQYVLTMMAAVVVPVVLLERFLLGTRMRSPVGRESRARVVRTAVKCVGLAVSFAGLYACYWLFPFLADGNGASLVPALFASLLIPLLVISPVYIWYIDDRMENPEDSLYAAGLFCTLQWGSVNWTKLKQHALGWLVKVFFFWYMAGVLAPNVNWWIGLDIIETVKADPFESVGIFISFVWMIDLVFSTTGYFCTFKLFNSENRSVDPTVAGWVACMICYGPMYGMLTYSFIPYENDYYWGHWLHPFPLVQTLWAIPIVVLLAIYMFSTIQFGIRFSNLTNRGIITNGTFRFTKHPQYISKNIAYWFIFIPFIPNSSLEDAVKTTIFMAMFSAVYYARAKTEENHLSRDPTYVAYADWIAKHGLLAKLFKRRTSVERVPQ